MTRLLTRVDGGGNKYRILDAIAKKGPMSARELREYLGLNRDTILTHGKDLINEGWLAKEGKFGKYHLTDKAKNDPDLRALIFRRNTIKKLTDWKLPFSFLPHNIDLSLANMNQFFTVDQKRLGNDEKYVRESFAKLNQFCQIDHERLRNDEKYSEEYSEEFQIFNFGNMIGAFITYVLIQAVRPNNFIHEFNELPSSPNLNGAEKDELATKWVNDVIIPTELLVRFCNLLVVKRGQAVFTNKSVKLRKLKLRKLDPDNPLWSRYEMDQRNFDKLNRAFSQTYPYIFEQLEKVRGELKNDIDKEKRWIKHNIRLQKRKEGNQK